MTRLFVLLFALTVGIFFSCNKEETPDPNCYDGIQNGNESGIDCGGDCLPCFECTSNYCSMISSALSTEELQFKLWSNPSVTDRTGYSFSNMGGITEYFHDDSPWATGNWKFDDPKDPSSFTITYLTKPSDWPDERVVDIIFLTADTLTIIDYYGMEATLVPEK